jgi:hypothetical protein
MKRNAYKRTLADIQKDDALGVAIREAMNEYRPRTVLEIGSSDGTGSTQVFLEQLLLLGGELFCIEMERDRYQDLCINTAPYKFVHPYHASSVDAGKVMSLEELNTFRSEHPDFTIWDVMGDVELYKWHSNTIRQSNEIAISSGIEYIKRQHKIKTFDMVLIDGGPFTAKAELDAVYGADVIFLDDVIDLKCYDVMVRLSMDERYKEIYYNENYRNGFAGYKLIQ